MKRFAAATFVVALLLALLAPAAVLAVGPTFGPPSVTAQLDSPLTFTSTIDGPDIATVDVLIHLEGNPTTVVVNAGTQINNIFQAQADINIASSAACACLAPGTTPPNTHFDYQFRVTDSNGATSVGPVAQGVFVDNRFEWQTLTEDQVVVHWYAGDQAFGKSAADVANGAIDTASQVLGVTLDKPVDLFVYNTEDDMRSAISPDRENVAGEAHPDIDTMYVWIPSDQAADSFAGTLIRHELTHLVFHRAVDNPYHGVPRWLDEGTAVYLSEGYSSYWQGFVNGAVANKTLIPLDGLAGLFPSVQSEFYLAYGEAVAAVDYFIRTYGDQTFWSLVKSYGNGVSDDAAFTAATGSDVDAFNAAWFQSLGLTPPPPAGPQQGAPGAVPPDWVGFDVPPTLSPPGAPGAPSTARPSQGTIGGPGGTARPVATGGQAGAPSANEPSQSDPTSILLVLGLVVALVVGTLAVGLALRGRSGGPPVSGF